MRSARVAFCLYGLCGALLGCGKAAAPSFTDDPGDASARAREAETALRRLGDGRFTVDAFHPGAEERLTFHDDYDYPTRILALHFKAQVHATAEVDLPGAEELMARKAEPNLSLPDLERDLTLLDLFGEGELHPGDSRAVEAIAAFDMLEPGYRFRLFDRARAPSP
ncbi:MAG: hypothetical protein ABI193_15475 [Minicystis sp.]